MYRENAKPQVYVEEIKPNIWWRIAIQWYRFLYWATKSIHWQNKMITACLSGTAEWDKCVTCGLKDCDCPDLTLYE
jgi:hypothetical protein